MPQLPAPRMLDPEAVPALRWGIVGTGIADRFVRAMTLHTRQRPIAVTARDQAKTAEFAARHGIGAVLPTVQALVEHPEVDVVYISTPHPLHREQALAAIAAGKHVLIEKPIAMSAAEADDILTAARERGVIAMEAMWTRYLPQADIIRQVLEQGLLGEIHTVTADFGFSIPVMPEHRLWSAELGGGALLDAGVYPISFAQSVLGTPERVVAAGEVGETGVDSRADLLLSFPGGANALLSTSIVTSRPTVAPVAGQAGRLSIDSPFYGPTGLTLTTGGPGSEESEHWTDDSGLEQLHDGLGFQATALASYAAAGLTESPVHTHAEIVAVMATIDEARRQIAGAAGAEAAAR
jgi:predicted dehydrogenase